MDANMSDLIGGVLSNPDALNKVRTLLPLVSQMLKSDDSLPAATGVGGTDGSGSPPAISAPGASGQPVSPPAGNADIMANENVASAIQTLIAALNASSQSQAQANQNAIPVFAQTQPQQSPEPPFAPPPEQSPIESLNQSLNIERTLDTLKNVTAVANPENDHRAKLLLSLKPFLSESRKIKIDTAIKYINAAKILTSFGKNGFLKS
jgi:hypothetical protein